MIDVHAPHESVHTWKDFFIHIATIVIGLLIAVGLEQSVEALHHHEQVRHAREELHAERDKNLKLFALETRNFEYNTPVLLTNLAVFRYLRDHPGAATSTWPGSVRWYGGEVPFVTAAWNTVQRDGVIEHLSQDEVEQYEDMYERLKLVRAAEVEERSAISRAAQVYGSTDKLNRTSQGDLAKLMNATNEVLLAHGELAMEMGRLHARLPAFTPVPNFAPLAEILGLSARATSDPVQQQILREFYEISGHPETSTEH